MEWSDLELRFLAACIINPDVILLAESDHGLNESDFSSYKLRRAWSELSEYIREHNDVPSRAYVERVFPEEVLENLREPFSLLEKEGSTRRALGDAKEIIRLAEIRELSNTLNGGLLALTGDKADPDNVRADLAEHLLQTRKIGDVEHFTKTKDDVLSSVDDWVHGKSNSAVPTGIRSVDMAIGGGWILAGVGIVGGRRGSAKTALAMQMLISGARAGNAGMMISLEMTRDQLLLRYATRELGISVASLRAGNLIGQYDLIDKVKDKIAEIEEAPIYICDASDLSIYQLNDLIRLQVLRNGLRIVYVDYAELINVPGREGYEQIKNVYKIFKATAKKYNIAIVVLSQLGRSVEHDQSKFPDDAALKFAGEDEGDTIMLLWNVAGYQSRGITVTAPKWVLDTGVLEKDPNTGLFRTDRLPLIISKAKWGQTGVIGLGFDPNIGKIYDPVFRRPDGR